MKRFFAILALAIFSLFLVGGTAVATNHKFPLCHGKNSVPCRPDPQPSHGKDCLKHGKGGVNEDHCAGDPTPTVSPSPSESPSVTPSPTLSPSDGTGRRPTTHHVGQLAQTGPDGAAITLIAALGLLALLFGFAVRKSAKR